MPDWAYGALVTVVLALLGYLVKGLLTWGHVTGALQAEIGQLRQKTEETHDAVETIQKEMLRPADLRAAVLEMQLQIVKDMIKRKEEDL